MIKSDFLKLLEPFPDDAQVIIRKDPEEDDFSPLVSVEGSFVFVPARFGLGKAYAVDYCSATEYGMTEEAWDRIKALPKAIVLIPKY